MIRTRDVMPEEQFIELVTNHLRQLSRKIMKIDTKDEILQFLSNTFIETLNSDFVAIGLIDEDQLVLSNFSGNFDPLKEIFPYPVNEINPTLFERSLMSTDPIIKMNSPLRQLLEREEIDSWFTMPISDETEVYGLAIVGYHQKTILYEQLQRHLDEVGTYIAIALNLIKRNQQKERTMLDLSYLTNSFTSDRSLRELVEKVVTMAAKESRALSAAIYLLDDDKDELILLEPTYGMFTKNDTIPLDKNNVLETYVPNVEKVGYHQITIPLITEMEMIGVLYVEKEQDKFFTGKHLESLQMYANYFSAIYENAQLTLNEQRFTKRLKNILKIQQQFVRKTVESDGFAELNRYLSELLSSSVILFDRFFNVLEYHLTPKDPLSHEQIMVAAQNYRNSKNLSSTSFMMEILPERLFEVMAINDGSEVHAFIAIESHLGANIELLAFTVNMVNSVYSIQFNKRKLEWRANEQIKDAFVQQLLVPDISSLDQILEYANVFHWDLYSVHRVAVIALRIDDMFADLNVLEQKKRLSRMLEYLKESIKSYNSSVIISNIQDKLVIFTPVLKVKPKVYWEKLMKHLQADFERYDLPIEFVLAVGGLTSQPEDYFESYQKALHTANVLLKKPEESPFAFFDDLGSYTVLNWVKDNPSSVVFMRHYLKELYLLSANQQLDLYETLRCYLEYNGNITATSDKLFLHRSTLNYRLQRIKEIVTIDIEDADERFNLMLAYKLADLHDGSVFDEGMLEL